MEVLIFIPLVLLAMVLPMGIVLAVLIGSLALSIPTGGATLPVAGGAFLIFIIKYYGTG